MMRDARPRLVRGHVAGGRHRGPSEKLHDE
jgi:hypothetical protein